MLNLSSLLLFEILIETSTVGTGRRMTPSSLSPSISLVEHWCDKLQQQLEWWPGILCSPPYIPARTHPLPGTHQSRQGTHLTHTHAHMQTIARTHTHSFIIPIKSSWNGHPHWRDISDTRMDTSNMMTFYVLNKCFLQVHSSSSTSKAPFIALHFNTLH